MQIGPEQLRHALEPLNTVNVKTLDDIAVSLKTSKNKQKRAVGVFLERINRYRLEDSSPAGKIPRSAPETELRDLP